jgi:hypothetical protein
MPSQQYQALPVEDKLDEGQPSTPSPVSKWTRTRMVLVLSLLFLVSFTFVAATARVFTRQSPNTQSTDVVEPVSEEWLREHLTRATGDTYTIGVGKADITGYVYVLRRGTVYRPMLIEQDQL